LRFQNEIRTIHNVKSADESATVTSVTGAQTLLRALDILDAFAEEGASLSLADLGRRAGLTAPTTHRLVKALVSRGFLVTDTSRRYSLGPAVMRLASVVMHRTDDLAALSMPTLERLRELTGETASLHCLLGNERICVAELVSPEPIRMQSDVGRTYPIHAGAAGKAILAWQPEVLDRPGLRLAQVTPATITDAAKLRRELERIRQRGYAESESEVVPGAASLAVPVLGGPTGVLAAVNVAGPAMRWNRAKRGQFRDAVVAEVAALTALTTAAGPNRAGARR
jgi:IclR family acetate operon transcriptional repressor